MFPAEALTVARRFSGLELGVLAVDLEVAEFGVRHQLAVEEERAADPRAQRQQHHRARDTSPSTESHLGKTRSVGVVDGGYLAAGGRRQGSCDIGADPPDVDV